MERIWHFLADRSVELADRIEGAIRERVLRLEQFPMLGRPKDGLGIRELSLVDLQYRVAYVLTDDQVRIASVRSTRENA